MSALIWTVCANPDEARALGRMLVEEGLVACANLVAGVESIFAWDGKVQTAGECGILFKTDARLLSRAVERIEQLHPYATPAILGWQCNETGVATGNWLAGLTGGVDAASDRVGNNEA